MMMAASDWAEEMMARIGARHSGSFRLRLADST